MGSRTRVGLAVLLTSAFLVGCAPRDESASRDAPPAGGGPTTTAAPPAASDTGDVGSAAKALLSPGVPAAVIEVDTAPGARLSGDVIDALRDPLARHGHKRSVTTGGASDLPARPVYTAGDLRDLAAASRITRSEPGRAAVYVMVLPGRFEDASATGVAFDATAFAVFPEQISGGLLGLNAGEFERAVLVHELGHLFGLVDLTGHGAFHEDPEHKGHSNSRASVMYWAIEDVSLRQVFAGGPPTEFDPGDTQEMERIRADG